MIGHLLGSSIELSPAYRRLLGLVSLHVLFVGSATLAGAQDGQPTAIEASSAPTSNNAAVEASESAKTNLDSYEKVWTSIRDTHWDPTLGGLDWDACKAEFQPTLEDAGDIKKVRISMAKLISKLQQSHFVVIPSALYGAGNEATENGTGWAGIEFRFTDQGALIVDVSEGSPADRAGLKAGYKIVSIEEQPILEPKTLIEDEHVAERVAREIAYSKAGESLRGPIGAERKLVIEDMTGLQTEKSLTLVDEPGDLVAFGNLPKMNLQIETKILEGDIGYISLSIFLSPSTVMEKISEFVKQHPEANGMIIDIRGNPGGIGAMAGGIAGWFAEDAEEHLGTMILRNGTFKLIAFKQRGAYQGPVAVLVDDRSASTSEIFASGMQKTGRARVFGQTTAGAALPAMIEILPNGDRFLHAFAALKDLEGQPLEGVGVVPDEMVPLNQETLASGDDPVLKSAIKWIIEKSQSK